MKNIFYFLLLCLFMACTNANNNGQNKATENANITIVKQSFDYFNKYDWAKMATLYIDNAELWEPSMGQEVKKHTPAQIIQKFTELNKMVPDVHNEIGQIYPSGDKHVIVEYTSRGTGPDGKKFTLPMCSVYTFDKGKISRDMTYYDNF
jgi:ketosteroid isomerase-like protein